MGVITLQMAIYFTKDATTFYNNNMGIITPWMPLKCIIMNMYIKALEMPPMLTMMIGVITVGCPSNVLHEYKHNYFQDAPTIYKMKMGILTVWMPLESIIK
jgi:hypothetical protein